MGSSMSSESVLWRRSWEELGGCGWSMNWIMLLTYLWSELISEFFF